MTAGMTLTGPANSSLEDPPYKRHPPPLPPQPPSATPPPLAVAPPAPTSYKLPPDLELSKAEDGEGMEDDVEDISSASVHNHKSRQVHHHHDYLWFCLTQFIYLKPEFHLVLCYKIEEGKEYKVENMSKYEKVENMLDICHYVS